MESLLVTVNDLKNFTSISQNIDADMLFPFLLISQQTLIEPILGTALYDDIITKFDNSTITGNDQILYEQYLIPAIGYGAWYLALPFLAYKTNRNGVNVSGTDTLTPVSTDELIILTNRLNSLKDFYLNKLEEYLCDNKTLFPLYRQNDVHEGTGSPIYLGYRSKRVTQEYWDRETVDPLLLSDDDCSSC